LDFADLIFYVFYKREMLKKRGENKEKTLRKRKTYDSLLRIPRALRSLGRGKQTGVKL